MKTVQLVVLLLFPLVLTACSGPEGSAQRAVIASLKDPDSAKFGKFTRFGKDLACLTVNAKNSMGGYTGDQQAFLIELKDGWNVISISKGSQEFCIDFATKDEGAKRLLEELRKL